MFGKVIVLFMCGALFGAMAMALYNAIMLPSVYYSYSTGECAYVINHEPQHTFDCDNLPFRYHHNWVE